MKLMEAHEDLIGSLNESHPVDLAKASALIHDALILLSEKGQVGERRQIRRVIDFWTAYARARLFSTAPPDAGEPPKAAPKAVARKRHSGGSAPAPTPIYETVFVVSQSQAVPGLRSTTQVLVRDNNVDAALKALKKKMQREGVFREMKLRRHDETPSQRRARDAADAVRRARKLERKKLDKEGF